jgi:two-component system sensor histidine kinase YesM
MQGLRNLWKRLRPVHYGTKLLGAFLLTALLPSILISFVSTGITREILREELVNSIRLSMEQVTLNLDNRMSQMNDVVDLAVKNRIVQSYVLGSFGGSPSLQIAQLTELRRQLMDFESTFSLYRVRVYFSSRFDVGTDGRNLVEGFDAEKDPVFARYLGSQDSVVFLPTRTDSDGLGTTVRIITALKVIRNVNLKDPVIGLCTVDILESELYSVLSRVSLAEGDTVALIDPSGILLSGKDKDDLGSTYNVPFLSRVRDETNGAFVFDHRLVVVREMIGSGWRIVYSLPESYLNGRLAGLFLLELFGLLGAILLGVSVSLLFSRSLSRKIGYLAERMAGVSESHGSFTLDRIGPFKPGSDKDEIDGLIDAYNRMAQSISSLVTENYAIKLVEKESQLSALQSQINPHFLYNVLDSVKSCLEGGKTSDAVDMILSLSRFFRIALSRGADFIPLRDEIEMAEQYLHLQKMHYGNRFDASFDLDPLILDVLVPKFTLQPIIENAILHGLKKTRSDGRIDVVGRSHGDEVRITVSDNGLGFPEPLRDELNRQLEESGVGTGKGYGLRNVNARLKLRYGASSGLTIENPMHGSSIAVRIVV